MKRVKVGKEIGRGAYGKVFEVEYEKIPYAAKEIHRLLLESAQGKDLENIKETFSTSVTFGICSGIHVSHRL